MIFKMKTLLLFFVLYMFMNFDTVIAKKRTRRRNRHFCPSLQGKKRPAVLNVEASLQLAQGKAIFRLNTCADSPACFLATTNKTSPIAVENSLWQRLLDAFMGNLDIEPSFQFMKTSFKEMVGLPQGFQLKIPTQNVQTKTSKQEHVLSYSIPSSILTTYPNLDRLCKDAYGVYSFVPVKNLTKSRSSKISQIQTVSELLSKLSRNNSRSKSTRVQKPKRRARAPWQKLSLQRMFVNCASCSRICVQNNPVSSNQKIVFCSIIRIKCAFQCGILERFMKRQRIKRKA